MTLIPSDIAKEAESVCQESMQIVKKLAECDGEIINIGPNMAERIRTNARAIDDLSRRVSQRGDA